MRIVFCGNNNRGSECLSYLAKSKEIEVLLAIGHYVEFDTFSEYFSSIKTTAKNNNIEYFCPKNINELESRKKIKELEPDIMVLVGYSQNILKRETFEIPKFGTINIHASLLPDYRGAAPLNWAIISGEKKIGFSIIEIDEGVDTGPIIEQHEISFNESDDISTVTNKINSMVGPVVLSVLLNIETKLKKKRFQKIDEGFFCSKRKPDDGLINFQELSSFEVIRLVKALCHPYPGAFFIFHDQKFIVDRAYTPKSNFYGIPGRIVQIKKQHITVVCKDRGLCLELRNISDHSKIQFFKISEDIK